MIRYDYDAAEIEESVDALGRNWRQRASQRTQAIVGAGQFNENSSIWSEIKPAFIALQNNKCIFCERQLESAEYGLIEHDLEHFRPKSAVKRWPPESWHTQYQVSLGADKPSGYYWLAYDLQNYAAACKVCNTPLKSSYFPIAGKRARNRASFNQLQKERPLLCYPIGSSDENPEELVAFRATIAVPAAGSGHRKVRGEVIIDFFKLNDREQLHRDRARMISLLGVALEKISQQVDVETYSQVVDSMLQPTFPHTNCLRSFCAVWDADPILAKKMRDACYVYACNVGEDGPPKF